MPFSSGYYWGRYKEPLCLPSTLPSFKLLGEKEIDRLQDMGFVFGDFVDESDEFVQHATFPRGWSKVLYEQNTQHRLWTLVDGDGHERVRADGWDTFEIHFMCRFSFREVLSQGSDAVMVWIVDLVSRKPAYTSQVYYYPSCSDRKVEQRDRFGEVIVTPYGVALSSALDEARAWVARFYPEYNNPCSYWD